PSSATAAWTVKMKGDVSWQQVTPAGVLLVSTDAALSGVDIERGQVAWEKPELGGLPADSVRMVEGSLLMEAGRRGLLLVFDPVTGVVVFDSRRLNLTQVVTRRVLPQSGTLLVHGRRASGPPVVALYDLVTGAQRWANEGLFEQSGPAKRGLGGLMQGLARAVSGGTELGVLQAGPDMIVVHTLLGLRALDARTGAVRGSAVLAVDAESRTFVNVLDVATATVRLKKDVKIKGQLAYAELTPAGLLYISRPDAATNAEVNVIDLGTGEPKFKDAIESGRPL